MGSSVNIDTWQYLAISYGTVNGAKTMTLHVDGVPFSAAAATFVSNVGFIPTSGFHIGCGSPNMFFFDGDIKDVSFYTAVISTGDILIRMHRPQIVKVSVPANLGANSPIVAMIDMNRASNMAFDMDFFSSTTVGRSADATTNSTSPPCAPNSELINGVCWVFLCPPGQYHNSTTECQNMTNSTCPIGIGFQSSSAKDTTTYRGSTSNDGSCTRCIPGQYKNTSSPSA
jgi:hypothetical protein